MQKKSLIKQNILQYLDFIGVTKYQFYKNTGITRGVLDQSSGISEENTAKFLAYYPDINPHWLLTGEGDMLKKSEAEEKTDNQHTLNIGKRLAEYAEKQGISIKDFAIKCDIGYNNTASLLKGSLPLGMQVLQKIKKGFPNLNTEWVLFANGPVEISSVDLSAKSNKEVEQLEQMNFLLNNALRDKDKTIESLEGQIKLLQELKDLKALDESPIKSNVGQR